MAKYRALGPLYVRRLITAGEEFESDLPPGRNWEPLDDEARAAVEKFRTTNANVLAIVEAKDPKRPEYAAINIPKNWATQSGPKRRALAQKLGAQSNVRETDANSFIEAELERRGQKAA